MLSQRILARRLPQVAARAIAPRASFSQIPALRAAEIDDPLQVWHPCGTDAVPLLGIREPNPRG